MNIEDKISVFMRAYGLRILYFVFVYYFTERYLELLTETDYDDFPLPEFSFRTQLAIWCFRLGGIGGFVAAVPMVSMFFFAKFPSFSDETDADAKPFNHRQKIDTAQNPGSTEAIMKRYVPCIIVRIITRGDYPELIRRNVAHHLKLFDRYCRCNRLEAHVVTEREIGGNYRFGDNAFVKEFVVPDTYKTKKGTLYHAKNVCYWLDNAFSNPNDIYPPEDQTWILNLDEDVFCTELFVRDFADRFLDSGAVSSVNPTLYDLPKGAGMIGGYEETYIVALFNTMGWFETCVMKSTPLWYKTAAHVIRADVDRKIGHDFGPHLSVGDDMVFGNGLAKGGYKLAYINGWTWEGGAPNLIGLIKQRSRWLRSVIYCTIYQDMSIQRKILNGVMLFFCYIVQGFLAVGALYYAIFSWFDSDDLLFEAPPRLFLDYFVAIGFASHVFSMIFGAWHIMSARRAFVHTIGVFISLGLVALCACNFAELTCSLWTLTREFYFQRLIFEVTEKPSFDKKFP